MHETSQSLSLSELEFRTELEKARSSRADNLPETGIVHFPEIVTVWPTPQKAPIIAARMRLR